MVFLYIVAYVLASGVILAGIYELIALTTGKLPTITSVVRPLVMKNLVVSALLSGGVFLFLLWLLLHFFTPYNFL